MEVGGYLKNLWTYSHSALDKRAYFLNKTRARISIDARHSVIRAHVDYDHELLVGSYFRTTEYRVFGLSGPDSWLDLDQDISTTATSI